jgi:hypothetical protein
MWVTSNRKLWHKGGRKSRHCDCHPDRSERRLRTEWRGLAINMYTRCRRRDSSAPPAKAAGSARNDSSTSRSAHSVIQSRATAKQRSACAELESRFNPGITTLLREVYMALNQSNASDQWVSDKFLQFVDIVFGVVVAQGFSRYSDLILHPLSSPLQTLALAVVYLTTTLSWIGYHRSMHRFPYDTRSMRSWPRIVLDFIIVSLYARLLFSITDLGNEPSTAYLFDIILGYVLVFFIYVCSGISRIWELGNPKASRLKELCFLVAAYSLLLVIYTYLRITLDPVVVNYLFITFCALVYVGYRAWRHRKYEPFNRY